VADHWGWVLGGGAGEACPISLKAKLAAPISHELEAPPAALVLAGRNDATHCCVTVTETCECEKRTKQKNEQRKATYRPPSHGVKPGAGGGGGGGGGGEKDFFAALLSGGAGVRAGCLGIRGLGVGLARFCPGDGVFICMLLFITAVSTSVLHPRTRQQMLGGEGRWGWGQGVGASHMWLVGGGGRKWARWLPTSCVRRIHANKLSATGLWAAAKEGYVTDAGALHSLVQVVQGTRERVRSSALAQFQNFV
jgi:hypothetical protein